MKALHKKLLRTHVMAGLLAITCIGVGTAAQACGCTQDGLTPGYWKNHIEAWCPGYTPETLLSDVFDLPEWWLAEHAGDTFIDALNYHGGPGDVGAGQILLRAAVAALLNICLEDEVGPEVFDYPATEADIIWNVNGAFTYGRNVLLSYKDYVDAWNNLGINN